MAFGDVGGTISELVITCKTPASGGVAISKGDAARGYARPPNANANQPTTSPFSLPTSPF